MPDSELTVMTYNLYGSGEGELAFERRVNLVADTIAGVNPDVLCLQEVPSAQFLRALMAMFMRRLGKTMRVATTEVERADGAAYRVAVMHPGTRRVASWLRTEAGLRVGIEVALGSPQVAVVCTHFDSKDPELRAAQAAVVGARAERAPAMLVCGDFNAELGSAELAAVAAHLEQLAPAEGVEYTFPTGLRPDQAERERAVYDLVLGRGLEVTDSGVVGLEANEGGLWPSDHAGVWARLKTTG